MTLREWDDEMMRVAELGRQIRVMQIEAARIEQAAEKRSGLECHDREPGFPCWWSPKLRKYFDTPRQAIEAEGN